MEERIRLRTSRLDCIGRNWKQLSQFCHSPSCHRVGIRRTCRRCGCGCDRERKYQCYSSWPPASAWGGPIGLCPSDVRIILIFLTSDMTCHKVQASASNMSAVCWEEYNVYNVHIICTLMRAAAAMGSVTCLARLTLSGHPTTTTY